MGKRGKHSFFRARPSRGRPAALPPYRPRPRRKAGVGRGLPIALNLCIAFANALQHRPTDRPRVPSHSLRQCFLRLRFSRRAAARGAIKCRAPSARASRMQRRTMPYESSELRSHAPRSLTHAHPLGRRLHHHHAMSAAAASQPRRKKKICTIMLARTSCS